MATHTVLMSTSLGDMKIELDPTKAPTTVKNFLSYVDDGFYDGTIFHRVISNFMIQGGGFEPGMKQKANKGPIKNESTNGLSNLRGTLAMARTNVPDSATSQFFINVKDNDFLDRAKSQDGVGIDVVDKTKTVKTGSKGGHGDVPVQDVTINSVRRAE
jgi:peptidyl-prolyl cis-trans isomerase B (cyclophilin B)